MPIPDYQSLMRPLLAFASNGSEKNINDAIKGIANQLGLTEEERDQLLPSGKRPYLQIGFTGHERIWIKLVP